MGPPTSLTFESPSLAWALLLGMGCIAYSPGSQRMNPGDESEALPTLLGLLPSREGLHRTFMMMSTRARCSRRLLTGGRAPDLGSF